MARVSALETLETLEREIERIGFRPASTHTASVVPTGLQVLDDLLPDGGLPRGQVVEWSGPSSSGKTAVLRASLARLRRDGESVALIDGTRALYAPDWVQLVPGEGEFWVVRPGSAPEATWCADLLLRSGAFGAVALRIAEPAATLGRGASVRLQRLAEEAAAVFVTMGPVAIAALRIDFRPGHIEPLTDTGFGTFLPPVRPVWIRVGKHGATEVPVLCPVPTQRRLPIMRDRKGPL